MAAASPQHPAILREQALLVRDGKIAHEGGPRDPGEWVYVWTRPEEDLAILYVGATALALPERVQLHLESPVPTIGRVRAEHPEALVGQVVVRGFLLAPGTDRQAVKRALTARLADHAPDPADGVVLPIVTAIAARLGR